MSLAGFVSVGIARTHFDSCQFDYTFVDGYPTYGLSQTILDEKESRTPAQKKIDSQLLYALKQKRGVTKGVPTERIEIEVDQRGRALVDITAIVTPQVVAQIRKLGGEKISDDARYHYQLDEKVTSLIRSLPLAVLYYVAFRLKGEFLGKATLPLTRSFCRNFLLSVLSCR